MADVADRTEALNRRAEELNQELGNYFSRLDADQRAGAPEESAFVREREDELESIRQELSKIGAPPPSAASPSSPPTSAATPRPPASSAERDDPMEVALRTRTLVSVRGIADVAAPGRPSSRYLSINVAAFLDAASLGAVRSPAGPPIVEAADLLLAILHGSARDRAREDIWHGRLWSFLERNVGRAGAILSEADGAKSGTGLPIATDALVGTSLIEVLAAASGLRRRTNANWPDIGVRHVFAALLTTPAGRVAMHGAGLFDRGFAEFRDAFLAFVVESGVKYYDDELEAWHGVADDLRRIAWVPPGRERTKVESDNAQPVDAFGAKADADALAELITLESAGTPMAIGIFGHWGTGKSTLMRLTQNSVKDLADTERLLRNDDGSVAPDDTRDAELRRVANVVQIRFNAWTYADSENLWASLTADFFDQLAAGGIDPWLERERGLRLVKEIAKRVSDEQKVALKSESEIEDIQRTIAMAKERLDVTEKKRDDIDRDAAVEALKGQLGLILSKDSPERDPTLLALSAIGVDRATLGVDRGPKFMTAAEKEKASQQMADNLAGTIVDFASAPGVIARFWRNKSLLFKRRAWMRWSNPLIYWVLGVAVVFVGGAAFLRVSGGDGSAAFLDAHRWWLAGLGSVLSIAHYAYRLFKPIFQVAERYEDARIRKAIEIDKEIAEIKKAKVEAEDKLQTLNKARDRALEFSRSYERASTGESPARTLQYLLQESADLSAVRAKLGFLATVRRCFEHLEYVIRLAKTPPKATGTGSAPAAAPAATTAALSATATGEVAVPRIDRIVLYIDDLDRCSEAKVVQVLEAVHLLLAFEFFVVIVAVDPRWLRLALASHYEKQLASISDDVPDPLRPTVSDYVEKIFQIPFLVRPLSENNFTGYGSYLDRLFAGQIEGGEPAQPVPAPPPEGPVTVDGIEFRPAPEGYVSPGAREDSERRLLVTRPEIALLRTLGPLAAKSPRAVKRMMNIYRLMRVRLSGPALAAFVSGADGNPPAYCAVAFALACEVGLHPSTVAAMERVIALALTGTAKSVEPKTPFNNALSEGWLEHERAMKRSGDAAMRADNDDYEVVVALADALAAERKAAVLSAAIAAVTKAQGNQPLTAADLAAAFHEVRRYSFRS